MTIGAVNRLREAEASGRPDLIGLDTRPVISPGFTKTLEQGLPTLYWITLFGPPYVKLFGRARLLQAPVFATREHPWGIEVQITDSPPTAAAWADFRDARNRAIAFLGAQAFGRNASVTPAFASFKPASFGSP
jgi:hypothetical protein